MKNKSNEGIWNFAETYERMLKIEKDFKKVLDKLYSLDFIVENNLIEDMLKLSKGLDEIILKYDYLLDKNKY